MGIFIAVVFGFSGLLVGWVGGRIVARREAIQAERRAGGEGQ